MTLFRNTSSLRERSLDETLRLARTLAVRVGVVRVTDITRLDRLDVPVFASIRPDAVPNSLSVSAGKGMLPDEARVGAYMEAIELAFAEPGRAGIEIVHARARELGAPLFDFCPRAGASLDDDAQLACVAAVDVDTGATELVPAGRVFFPLVEDPLFTSDTNGLSSGNSLLEATVHGLAEVLERDILTFERMRRTSRVVRAASLPAPLAELATLSRERGVALEVRTVANDYALPFFQAFLQDVALRTNGRHEGTGCHPSSSIAATRAICEAFQSRLTMIHGGRDDLLRLRAPQPKTSAPPVVPPPSTDGVAYDELVDRAPETTSLDAAYRLLRDAIRSAGAGPIFRVAFTQPDEPLQVVKVIVPRLEFLNVHADSRVGPRLREAMR